MVLRFSQHREISWFLFADIADDVSEHRAVSTPNSPRYGGPDGS